MTQHDDAKHLANQFLIAMPGMVDDTFAGTVVYLCDHTDNGAMGLVINRPTDVDLANVFDKIDLQLEIQPLAKKPVYFGGPVQTDRGFVLHEQKASTDYSSSLKVPGGLAMTTSKDVLEAVASGNGPERFLMTLGYAGWSAGQLEDEISRNGWLNIQAPTDEMAQIIFETPNEDKYDKVLALLGIDASFLSSEAGHA
ncbi:YqgE/AlgH family protein [Polynucleobacter sp. MWH-Spelu-300-X4]|uniref:YqgE/AlgH family protein n=1 Tax=Polynucleobacter sp. MWH-Spelu-300-X4 TaxID=2689109 RepID=UPI001BFDCF36|nr:YqgE/AlgH family protein [Polynucleobacter sp. MWH-Spelu-300-X4]QWD80028.1 YqgE/AlgH family protein [Polynucleobacter sp. MWH-Spelu-300-X4]